MKVLNETANCSYAFRNITVVYLKSVLWDLVFIIYKYRYYRGYFIPAWRISARPTFA